MRFILSFALAALAMTARTAYSATEIGSVQETAPSASSRLKIDLFGWSYGNAIHNWDGRRATPDGNPGDPIQITNQINFHTPAFGAMDFTVVPQFVLQPFIGNQIVGDRIQLQNPTVGMQGVVYENGPFSYWARYEFTVPVTSKSRADGMIVGPQSINSLAYQVPGSKFKLEAVIVPSINFFNNGETSSFVYASPRLYYQASQSFWLISILETTFETKRGRGLLELTRASHPNLGAGFRYITANGKGLYVQPFLNVFPFGRVASEAHIGVIFGGPLL